MDWQYTTRAAGNLVQTGQTHAHRRSGHHRRRPVARLRATAPARRQAVARPPAQSFAHTATQYAAGWRRYLHGLRRAPASLRTARERAGVPRLGDGARGERGQDRIRGAYVASPTMPWAWGGQQNPSGPYHLVWSRDLYEIATALIADGDRAGANRALTFLFDTQQKPDGSFPQNSDVAGTPVWTGLQLDEVADPIVLAYQLHRTGAAD